jgi:hypothetical protein
MRIAVIAPPWLPVPRKAMAGPNSSLTRLGLAAAGHDVLLYASGDCSCPVERAWTYPEHLGTVAISPAAELRHGMDGYDTVLAGLAGATLAEESSTSGADQIGVLPFEAIDTRVGARPRSLSV